MAEKFMQAENRGHGGGKRGWGGGEKQVIDLEWPNVMNHVKNIKYIAYIYLYWLFRIIHNYIHSTSLMTFIQMGLGLRLGDIRGIRGDRRFKGRGGYPMETSYHFIHQNTV